jgi:hypothetical protein
MPFHPTRRRFLQASAAVLGHSLLGKAAKSPCEALQGQQVVFVSLYQVQNGRYTTYFTRA